MNGVSEIMTVRELINKLLDYDADEQIELYYENGKHRLQIADRACDYKYPWIAFEEVCEEECEDD